MNDNEDLLSAWWAWLTGVMVAEGQPGRSVAAEDQPGRHVAAARGATVTPGYSDVPRRANGSRAPAGPLRKAS